MKPSFLEDQLRADRSGRPYVLATVVETKGSTPRSVGSRMLVFVDGTITGTVGGGALEQQVIDDAVSLVGTSTKGLRTYSNQVEGAEPACGGTITVYLEASAATPRLVVCGAGHVGAAVIRLASGLGWDITVIDPREDGFVQENAEAADRLLRVESFAQGIADLEIAPGGFFLVSTFSHDEDRNALAAALRKDAAYIGMMGSPGKIAGIMRALGEQGFSDEELAGVYTPVGLDIGGENPAEIAVSIVSEMQMVRYGKSGRPGRDLRLDS